jgi:CPA1 family monovalent cation:H+ antiporter
MVLALLPFSPRLSLTKELLFTVLLPPLIFEAGFQLPWKPLRRNLSLILVLASAGVLLSASFTAVGMYYLAHWDWLSSLVFGALIAATDPVSVVATFREAKAQGRLLLLVEAESLFNDGTAAVAFAAALAWALGHNPTPIEMTGTVLMMVGGGLLCGAAVAGTMLLLAGRAEAISSRSPSPPWLPMAPSFSRSISTCPAYWPR